MNAARNGRPTPRSLLLLVALLGLLAPALAPSASASESTTSGDGRDALPEPVTNATGGVQPVVAATMKVGRIPEEVDAFRQARERYRARMAELETDTRAYVDESERAERIKLDAGYDPVIRTLSDKERSQRQSAIEQFESFLERYPSSEYTSHVRFRLADLYWEKGQDDYLVAQHDYDDLQRKLEAENRGDELPPPPQEDMSRPIELYKQIIADNEGKPKAEQYDRLDGAYYALGFCYRDENSAQRDDALGKSYFQTLVDQHPESDLVDDAHLIIGNFYFEENSFDPAINEYTIVYKKGPESPSYAKALYKLAWAQYKLAGPSTPDRYASGLALFTELLDYSEKLEKDTGRGSDYAPEGIKYTAFSFADISDQTQRDPVDVAQAYFAKVGPRDYEWDIYNSLAKVLMDYGRFNEAISVYKHLQVDERWKLRPENPTYQMQVVKLYASGPTPDPAASAAARIELTEKYNDQSEWWYANRHNPEALSTARRYIEESLVDVAIEYRIKADEHPDPAAYALAAQKYEEYLDRFPIADDYFKMQWEYTDTLFRAKDYGKAAKECESLIRSSRHHPYGDGAVMDLVASRQQIVGAKYGPPNKLPDDAAVERTYKTPAGSEIKVYALSVDHKNLVDAADAFVAHAFSEPDTKADPELQDYRDTASKLRVKAMYIAAQTLVTHHRYDEARPRLLAIINQFPSTDEASFAASDIVNSYQDEGDLASVRKYTKQFSTMPLGASQVDVAKNKEKFGNVMEQTAFYQAKGYGDAGDREKAAEAYLSFLDEFPKSKYANVALYNAAQSYQAVGKVERANELFEQYVAKYPKDEKSAGLYYKISALYEQIFEFDKAIDYLDRLVANFPDYKDAADAVYEQAFLKVGLGDHAGAAKGYEEYATKYPDKADAELVYFNAGEQWEQVSAQAGLKFYERYLQLPTKTPDHTLEARYPIAQIYKGEGNDRAYQKAMDDVQVDYDKLAGEGKTLNELSHHYAAEAAFRAQQSSFDQIVKVKLVPDNDQKNVQILKDQEAAILKWREEALGVATKYGDFEYTTAVLYLRASAIRYYADLGFTLQPSSKLSQEDQDLTRQIYEEQVYPKFFGAQDNAKTEYKKIIDLAREKKQTATWVDKSQDALHEMDPLAFPAIKTELVAAPDATIKPEIKPLASGDLQKKEVESRPVLPPEQAPPPDQPPGTPSPGTPTPGGQQ